MNVMPCIIASKQRQIWTRICISVGFSFSTNVQNVQKEVGSFRKQKNSTELDKISYLNILQALETIENVFRGRLLHSQIILRDLETDLVICNSLIKMYCKSGSLDDANSVFCKLTKKDSTSWSAIILGYIQNDSIENAMQLFPEMLDAGMMPSSTLLIHVSKLYGRKVAMDELKKLNDILRSTDLELDAISGSVLIDMNAKHGNMEDAHMVFNKMPKPNAVTWNSLIAGYVKKGDNLAAVELFEQMQSQMVVPTNVTFSCILKSCGTIRGIIEVQILHDKIIRAGFISDVVLGNTLIDAYSKCGFLEEALLVFNSLSSCDTVTWGALVSGHVQHGKDHVALELFEEMKQQGVIPNNFIFSSILKACNHIEALNQGKYVHVQIIYCGTASDNVIESCLIEMYGKCGSLIEARTVFDELRCRDVVAWSSIIASYAHHGQAYLAIRLFEKMKQEVVPNKVSFLCVLKACPKADDISCSFVVHNQIMLYGLESDLALGNSLLDVYITSGCTVEAHKVLCSLDCRDLESWGIVIGGSVQNGYNVLAIQLFDKMQQECVWPNIFILYSILKACVNIGAINQGRLIHYHIYANEIQLKDELGNCVVEMYAKCGYPDEALFVLESLPTRDIVPWTMVATSYVLAGRHEMVNNVLQSMQKYGVKVDHVMLTSLLAACSRTCLLNQGLDYFKSMLTDHDLSPKPEHYNCIINLLGRSGCLNGAEDILKAIPVSDFIGWISLLSSCKEHNNLQLGSLCYDEAKKLDSSDASAYILMSGMSRNVDEAPEMRKFVNRDRIKFENKIDVEPGAIDYLNIYNRICTPTNPDHFMKSVGFSNECTVCY